jgi:hypothetical protein
MTAAEAEAYVRPPASARPNPCDVIKTRAALAELVARPQWVCWKPRLRGGKSTKPPINARTGGTASVSDPSTWTTFDRARGSVPGEASGVGYVLRPEDSLVGVDLDGVRDLQTGELVDWAAEIIACGETYAEISPSGKGVRMFACGTIEKAIARSDISVEVYSQGRYLTVTGNKLETAPDAINEAPRTLERILARIEAHPPAPKGEVIQHPAAQPVGALSASSSGPWRRINDLAFANLEAWVPTLFPTARHNPGADTWRVASKDLGRDLEEDISISRAGAKDFGVHDMGDPRNGARTAIDLVIEWRGAPGPKEAAQWLADQMGEELNPRDPDAERLAAGVLEGAAAKYAAAEDAKAEAHGAAAKDAKPAVLRDAKWHGDDDASVLQEWAVENLIPKTGVTILAGQWGVYKTFVAIDLSASIMTGLDFARSPVRRTGGVLFFAAEGQSQVRPRLEGIARTKVTAAAMANDGVFPVDPAKMPFVWLERCPALTSKTAAQEMKEIGRAAAGEMSARFGFPLAMIVVDTMAAAAKFDDANDAAQAQKVMDALAAVSLDIGCPVVVVDHFGKDASTGTRNSSAKEGAADVVLALLAERSITGNVSNARLAVRKQRAGDTGTEIPFDARKVVIGQLPDGKEVTTLTIEWSKPIESDAGAKADEARPIALSSTSKILLRALEVVSDRARVERPFGDDGPEVKAVEIDVLKSEFFASYSVDARTDSQSKRDVQEAKRKAFKRAMEDLQVKKIIGYREIGDRQLVWDSRPARKA